MERTKALARSSGAEERVLSNIDSSMAPHSALCLAGISTAWGETQSERSASLDSSSTNNNNNNIIIIIIIYYYYYYYYYFYFYFFYFFIFY